MHPLIEQLRREGAHRLSKWKIHTSWIEEPGGGEPTSVSVQGPRTCPGDELDAAFAWTRFRLYDDDGQLCYEGKMNEYCETGFEPLWDYGTPNAGAVRIDVFEHGKWVPL